MAALQEAWWKLWESFERELLYQNRRPGTLEAYRRCARAFVAWLEANGHTDPTGVTREDVQRFLVHLWQERRLAPAGVRLHWSALHRFFRWAESENVIERSPMTRLVAPLVEQQAASVLSSEQLAALLAACQGREFGDRRDVAIIRFMVDTGVRRGELLGMEVLDLNLSARSATVVGKGNRPGVVYFGVKTARDLDRYLRIRDRHPKADLPALWLGGKGRLGDDGLAWMLDRRARQAGLGHVHPHQLRHAFADQMKGAGASDEDTMVLGRWRDPKVMRRYAAGRAQERAQATHRRLSPGDRL